QAGVGTPESTQPRVSRRRRIDRQQVQNAAAERVDDVRQFFNEVAQFARRRNDRVALLVQLLQLRVELSVRGSDQRLRLAEQARERAVNRVRGAIRIGVD